MTRRVRAELPAPVDLAIDVFGSPHRVAILRFLNESGPSTRGEIAAGIGGVAKTVQFHLRRLVAAGAVLSDPRAGEARSGQWVRYSSQPGRIADLQQALAEFLTPDN